MTHAHAPATQSAAHATATNTATVTVYEHAPPTQLAAPPHRPLPAIGKSISQWHQSAYDVLEIWGLERRMRISQPLRRLRSRGNATAIFYSFSSGFCSMTHFHAHAPATQSAAHATATATNTATITVYEHAPPTQLAVPPHRPLPAIEKKKRLTAIVTGATVATVGFVLLFAMAVVYFKRRKAKNRTDASYFKLVDIASLVAESLEYDLNTLQVATNNFSDKNKIGRGGFGVVYKGLLENGDEIAVKRLTCGSDQGIEEFKNEVVLVTKLQHKNLVRLLGFCLAGEEKLLVYEFVPNKSLDYILFDPNKQVQLNWTIRNKIIVGIARGLLYLHEESRLKIIHRDLKAANILLDSDMNPKISDFGIARLVGVDQSMNETERAAGTLGYMAPEYLLHGKFSVKSDVYSFGVLMLEIVCGKKVRSFQQSDYDDDLLSSAWKHWRDGTTLEFMDSSLTRSWYSSDQVMCCIQLGLLCVQRDFEKRPTMALVHHMLNNSYANVLPAPQQPAFFTDSDANSSSSLVLKKLRSESSTSKSMISLTIENRV